MASSPLIVLLLAGMGSSVAEEDEADDELPTLPSKATGDWAGARTWLQQNGVTVRGYLTGDWSRVLFRDDVRGVASLRGLAEAGITLDGERAWGWRGGSVYVGIQWFTGPSMTPLVGDVQVFDNMDAPPFLGLSEAWIQQMLWDGRIRIKLGRIEANSEFASVEQGAVPLHVRTRRLFLHSSMGFSPTILRFGSYPRQALGALMEIRLFDRVRWSMGAFDGTLTPSPLSTLQAPVPGVPFSTTSLIGELGVGWMAGMWPGRLALGGWGLVGQDVPCNREPCPEAGTGGGYGVFTQTVGNPKTGRGAGLFLQYGWAPPVASAIVHHVGGGVSLDGVLPGRSGDTLVLGGSWVWLQPAARTRAHETAVELSYRVALARAVWIQPDLQLLLDPGGQPEKALVGTLRLAVDL